MLRVCDVMSSPAITVELLDGVVKAARLMEKHSIGGLPVLDKGKLCGIITFRDVLRTHPNRIVADAISKNVIHVSSRDSLLHAMKIFEENKIEKLPVIENSRLVGMVTKTDVIFEMGKHIDNLTGLKKGSFIRSLAENFLAEGNEISVIFFDLNDFGIINKNFGHVYGDRCLKLIGQILNEATAGGAYFPGRYAGDEFIVVTTENLQRAGKWADEIIKKIERITEEQDLAVTVSAGIAGGQRSGGRTASHLSATVDDLINLASLASTSSKKDGRKITFAS